jgi:RNA polymerase sigma-70 factor (ECF subfamily)
MFAELYTRVQPLGVDHATWFLSESEAKDVVTDALGEVWARWHNLSPEQRTVAYCLGAIHHHILKRWRENKRLVDLDDAEADLSRIAFHEIESPTRAVTAADVLDLVVAAMPPRRRDVFLLIRELGYTYKEVAELLSMSEGTVNTHVRLAAEDLRAAFQRHGFRLASGRAARLASGAAKREATDV